MMETMRNLAKTLVAKLLLGLLVLAFGVWGISGIAGSAFDSALSLTGWGPKDLAQVGSTTINGDEFTKNLQRAVKKLAQQAGQPLTLDDAKKLGVDKQVLDSMVSQAAVNATVSNLQLSVSQQVILNEVSGEKTFQNASGKFDPVAFRRVLESNNMNEAQYFSMQALVHSESAVLNTASGQVVMPKALALALGQFQGETRDVKYFDLQASEADIVRPTDADLDVLYKKSPATYTAPEYRTAAVMRADAASLAASQVISDEELKAGYDKHKDAYFSPERRTIIQLPFASVEAAQKAKDRIAGGEDIMKIATELGLKDSDVTLADKVKGDFLDAKIAAAAFALSEGQVSDPVQGGLATALLKAVKVQAEKQPTLDEIKDKLKAQLQFDKAKTQLQQIYNDVEDARAQQNQKFEDIAKKLGLNLTLVPPISVSGQNQDGKDLGDVVLPEALKAIFASDVGVENDAIGSAEGYVWYDVRSIIPSALKPLDQVKDQVTKDAVNERITAAALDKAKKAVDALKGGKMIDALAGELATATKTVAAIKRQQQTPEFDGPTLAAAFAVGDRGFAFAPGGDGKSARVMQVTKVTEPAVMATSLELDQLKQNAKSGLGADMQAGLVAALKKSAGVKINEALWKQNTGGEAPPVE